MAPFGGGVVAQHKVLAGQQALLLAHRFTSILWIGSTLSGACRPPSSTKMAKSGQSRAHSPQLTQWESSVSLGGMVALGVGALGHDQHALGAELDAEAASFAPFLDDVDDAVGHLDAVAIQGLSPIGHGPSSIPAESDWLPSSKPDLEDDVQISIAAAR